MARIGGYGRALGLVLSGMLLALASLFWFAGTAHANCAVDPSDPMCMPAPTSPPATSPPATSPPQTSPPINRTSPTEAPVNREPQGTPQGETPQAPNPKAGFAPGGGVEYAPQLPPAENFGPANVTPPDTPSINANGQPVPAGGGAVSNSPLVAPTCQQSVLPPVPVLGWLMQILGQTGTGTVPCRGNNTALTDALAAAALGGGVLLAGVPLGRTDPKSAAMRAICKDLKAKYNKAHDEAEFLRTTDQQAQTDKNQMEMQEPQQPFLAGPGEPGYDALKYALAKKAYNDAHAKWHSDVANFDLVTEKKKEAEALETSLATQIANTCSQFMRRADAGDGSDDTAVASADDTADIGVV